MKGRVLLIYISGHYLVNILGATLGLAVLAELLDLLDSAVEVLDRGLGIAGLGTYVMLRMPAILDQVLTLGVLFGGIITFANASRRNEIIAMRAAGVTIYQIGFLLLPCAALVALLHFFISDQLVPRSTLALSNWWQSSAPPGEDQDAKEKPLWFRVGDDVVLIDRIIDNGQRLVGVHIYLRDANGGLTGRATAQEANYADGQWTLRNVAETSITAQGAQNKTIDIKPWNVRLTPANVTELGLPAAPLSTGASRSVLEGSRASNRAPRFYEMQIDEAYASAVTCFIMLLLSLPAAFSSRRDGSGGKLLIVSLVLGLTFVLSNGVLVSFGRAGDLPPLVATWTALAIFAMAGTTLLLNLEDR